MSRPQDTGSLSGRRSIPIIPRGCESGGCGGGTVPAHARNPAPAIFGAVVVNGVEIPAAAITEEAQQHPAPDGQAAWTAAARALVIRELLLQEARRLCITPQAECDEAGRREVEEEALIRALLEQEAPAASPTDAECRRYYEAAPQRFRTPDLFEAAHILIEPASNDAAGWAVAEREARVIAEEVGDDAVAFADAARALSRCPTAHQGGALGQVRRGELAVPVQAAIEALVPGRTRREPVRSAFGWHVVRLARRIEGRPLPFELVAGRIADLLEARSWAVSAVRYTATLAARAQIDGVQLDLSVLEAELA
jgi:peptidyl-prolyl cis-trans isomerase C